jgi:hypothetical protein
MRWDTNLAQAILSTLAMVQPNRHHKAPMSREAAVPSWHTLELAGRTISLVVQTIIFMSSASFK